MPFGRAFKRTWRLICEVITETTITKLEQWKLLMSVLGQKRTFAVQKGMSALPPKADVNRHVTTSELYPFSKIRSGARCRRPSGTLLQMPPTGPGVSIR